jgi:mannose-6-phosphate isomerase-like protein (cupin superfamily)
VSHHYRDQREVLFYVLAGTLSVETPENEFEVPAESVFLVTPNSPLRPFNPENGIYIT